MNKTLAFASVESPKTSLEWVSAPLAERINMIKQVIKQNDTFASTVDISEANAGGQLIVRFLTPLGPEMRGTILLDLEQELKDAVKCGFFGPLTY